MKFLNLLFLLLIPLLVWLQCDRPKAKKLLISENASWKIKTGFKTAQVIDMTHKFVIVAAGDYVAFGSPNHRVICYSLSDGSKQWEFDFGKGIIAAKIQIFGKYLLWQPMSGKTRYLNIENGKLVYLADKSKKWQQNRQNKNAKSVLFRKDKLTFLDRSGNAKWRVAKRNLENIEMNEKILCYAASNPRGVFCHDKKDGTLLYQAPIRVVPKVKNQQMINFNYKLGNRNIVIAHYDGIVEAFRLD